MDNNKLPNEKGISIDKETQINLVVNRSEEEYTIDLGRVFHNMKVTKGLYAWILILCIVAGLCVPLIMYQVNKPPLKVYSVVTLKYDIDNLNPQNDDDPKRIPVDDLTAPDGTELDLNQITSAFVLQNALNDMTLSQPITLSNLRSNIGIQRILTEESKRQQEILSAMVENKSSDAYQQMANMENEYTNTFIVSLSNGFGDEEDRVKLELKENELRLLLDQILIEYNGYLVKTYQDAQLPEDAISVIDMEELDIPESVDQFRTALRNLYTYCDEKTDEIKDYRSWQTGYSLNDLMLNLQLIQEVDVEYLYAYVFGNGIARDRDEVIDNYKYNLLVAQTEIEEINNNIEAVKVLLDNYKNDEILVSSPDSDKMQTAVTNTSYYNNLILQQADNEKMAAAKEQEITEIQTRIESLVSARGIVTQAETDEAEAELDRLAEKCQGINDLIRAHMEEIFATSFYNTLAEHSVALGKNPSFLAACLKNMIIGVVVGAIIGCVIWFLGGLSLEFSRRRERIEKIDAEKDKGVEA